MKSKLTMHMIRAIGNAVVFLCLAILILFIGLLFLSSMLGLQKTIFEFAPDWVGVIAMLFSGYFVVLALAVVLASIAGVFLTIGTLFWILRNYKEFKKYGDRTERNYKAQESQRLENWLMEYSKSVPGAVAVESVKGKKQKLHTLFFEPNAYHAYRNVFTHTLSELPLTWMVVENDNYRAIIARVELAKTTPHFVVNSIIEVDDLLPREYKNGHNINLEGDTNDYFRLTAAASGAEPLRILPPDVLLKLAQNFDEFDLEFRDTHLDIVMNEDRSADVMNARLKRIESFLVELSQEMAKTGPVQPAIAKQLLVHTRSWDRTLSIVAKKLLRSTPKIFLAMTAFLFVLFLLQMPKMDNGYALTAHLMETLYGSGLMAFIITIQWTLSTSLAVFALLFCLGAIRGFKYNLRRDLYSLKYEFYYKMQEMSDADLKAMKQAGE